jgi:hypothetical protein
VHAFAAATNKKTRKATTRSNQEEAENKQA